MSYQFMLFEVKDNVALVTFNRPDALNALNPTVISELSDILDKIKDDPGIGAVVLTGAGDKAFVAGADIKAMAEMTALQARNFAVMGQQVTLKIEALPQPVIAAVNGFALGGGTELALACDFIYASEKAKFGQPEINLGIIPGFGGTQRLAKLVGANMAKEICLTGDMIKAEAAQAMGLVNKIFPPDQVLDEALKTAGLIASRSKVAVRQIKYLIDQSQHTDIRTGLMLESESFGCLRRGADAQEGLSAFAEKRKAEFKAGYDG